MQQMMMSKGFFDQNQQTEGQQKCKEKAGTTVKSKIVDPNKKTRR